LAWIWGAKGTGSDFIAFKAGARFPLHDHEGREEVIMLSGKIRFGDNVVSAGDYLTTGPGDVHDAEALEDSVFFIAHVGGPVIKG
jgi:quercetin dioxygenase-like cupin family protein